MNEKHMQYVLTVLKEGSFTNAAKKLYVSQPSLSQIIKTAESNLGAPIFDRSTDPITLTPAGQLYVEAARQVTTISTNLVKQVEELSNEEFGKIRLGISVQRGMELLPELYPRFKKRFPHVEIELPGDPMKFTAVPNAIKGKGIWAASGVNEKNVGMTATETITSNARVLGADPLVKYQPAEDGKEEAAGGIGEHLAYALQQNGWNGRFLHCAVRTACLPHATVPQIKQCTGLDAADIVQAVRAALTKGENEL